jgi:tellurite resistance protein TerC
VLVLGVGAIVLRTVMIFAGVWLIAQFHWLLYVRRLPAVTGIKMWWFAEQQPDLANNPLIAGYAPHEGDRPAAWRALSSSTRRRPAGWCATPRRCSWCWCWSNFRPDLRRRFDPGHLRHHHRPFIVLTSNIFAILGLRAMYFLLADMADRSRCSSTAWPSC